jgi:anti-sigma factor RsiW
MKKVTQQWDDMLLEFLDGNLDNSQRAFVQECLQKDTNLQLRLEELRVVQDAFKTISLEAPSKNFTETVIRKLQEHPVRTGFSIRSSLFLLLGTVIVMCIAVILLSTGAFDQTTTVDLNSVSVAQKFIKQSLPTISIDGKWLVNGIVLLNLVIAFIVLDRAVLKPFFQRRLDKLNLHS